MTEKEYMLSRTLNNWLLFAEMSEGIPTNEATVMWNNHHNVGKYLICESREDDSTRLFIRNVTHALVDAYKKEGWWNTFTVTKTKTPKGLWLSKVIEYRLDRNGFLNLEVETIMPVDNVKFHNLFSFKSDNGTWNGIGWWLMMVKSNIFLKEYDFPIYSFHEPNYDALIERFPEASGLRQDEIGKVMLFKYLRNETTLEEIEECLNKHTDWEELVINVQKAVANHTLDILYGYQYPIFAEKVSINVIKDGMISITDVDSYLKRQLEYYNQLVNNQKIEPVDGGWLNMIEAALQYRKSLNDIKKEMKKAARKEKKKNIHDVNLSEGLKNER